ncbi:MAG: sporulation protein [Myxococcota bacterium]
MGFSDQMKDSLGAEGARVEVETSEEAVGRGGIARATVRIVGGTEPAKVDNIVLRVVQADRHWRDREGQAIADNDAMALADRSHLMPAWSLTTVFERSLEVNETVDSGAAHEVEVELPIPETCGTSSMACAVTLNAQADIKGQIDPTGNGRLTIA